MYVIIESSKINRVVWGNEGGIKENSPNSVRFSPDGTKFILEYDGEQPRWMFTKIARNLIGIRAHAQGEIIEIIRNPEWNENIIVKDEREDSENRSG
jgi:hypothetical protein